MANVSKRSHKVSSDSEVETKKMRYEDSSEEEEDEENDKGDEVEIDAVRKAQNVTSAGPVKWSVDDSRRLLVSITLLLPHCDMEIYNEREAQIDWAKVAFGSFSADECREHWHVLTKKVRVYRTMSDMVTDALSLLPCPASSFQMIQKNNQRHQKKPIIVKKKSSLPKLVMNAFSLFMKDKLQTLQHIPASERMKHVSQLYKLLSETEKNELMERYDELKKNHIKVLKKLKEDNPALAEEVDEQLLKLEKIPGKSKKPNVSVVSQNNSILKYMSQKSAPAQTVGGSDKMSDSTSGRSPKKSASVKTTSTPVNSKNSQSSDFAKRSESKKKSTMAAEEEDSSASSSSDDKEESYLLSQTSSKRSSPVKSASRHNKSKAVVEKHFVSDRSGSEDESDDSTGDFRKKSALKLQSTMATEEDSGASNSSDDKEEEQRSRPPNKSHSAIPAEISPIKKSMQMTSLKPTPKPGNELKLTKTSQSKRKGKKKKEKVTGLSQFVAAKKARYQQMYSELDDREITMKLAGKWERLSDKKKNKYEKLALQKMSSDEVD